MTDRGPCPGLGLGSVLMTLVMAALACAGDQVASGQVEVTPSPAPTRTRPRPASTATATATATPSSPTPVGQSGAWTLVFADEFTGTALDTGKWTTCYWWDDEGCTNAGNRELQWYRPENVSVAEGVLRLRAEAQSLLGSDGRTYAYSSGMVTTGPNLAGASPAIFTFRYGYAEMRARIPAGQGLWPAFWMLPDDRTSKPEIDVMEILGHAPDTLHMSIHYLDEAQDRARGAGKWTGPDFSAGWHTFAVDWRPDRIVWIVDGVERWRFTDTAHVEPKRMYLLINLAIGGDWPGAPDASTPFPSELLVDYVRVWAHGRRPLQALAAPGPGMWAEVHQGAKVSRRRP